MGDGGVSVVSAIEAILSENKSKVYQEGITGFDCDAASATVYVRCHPTNTSHLMRYARLRLDVQTTDLELTSDGFCVSVTLHDCDWKETPAFNWTDTGDSSSSSSPRPIATEENGGRSTSSRRMRHHCCCREDTLRFLVILSSMCVFAVSKYLA